MCRQGRNMFMAVAMCVSIGLCLSAQAGEEASAGGKWISLFDGKTLNGWEIIKSHHGTGGKWEVKDGVLSGTQHPPKVGGLLGTKKKYSDFEIIVEVNPDFGIDSGLFLRTDDRGRCYQITVDYRRRGQVGTLYGEGCGGWLGNNPQWKKAWKKGQWNEIRAIIQGQPPHIQSWLNGTKLVDFTDTKKRLPATGRIALQIHRGGDWKGKLTRFRNIRIRLLKPSK